MNFFKPTVTHYYLFESPQEFDWMYEFAEAKGIRTSMSFRQERWREAAATAYFNHGTLELVSDPFIEMEGYKHHHDVFSFMYAVTHQYG